MPYDERRIKRVIRDKTFVLRKNENEVVLAPVMGEVIRSYLIPATIVESILFFGLILFSMFGIAGGIDTNMILFLVIFMIYGTLAAAIMIGIVAFARIKTQRNTRFLLLPERRIVVKGDWGEDIVLDANDSVRFECRTEFDENGREMYDVMLKQDRNDYYLLSGYDKGDMERLRDALQQACHF